MAKNLTSKESGNHGSSAQIVNHGKTGSSFMDRLDSEIRREANRFNHGGSSFAKLQGNKPRPKAR